MRLLSYTNREVIEEARSLIGDKLASEERCKEYVRDFIKAAMREKFEVEWKPGDPLTAAQTEHVGFLWSQAIGKYNDE